MSRRKKQKVDINIYLETDDPMQYIYKLMSQNNPEISLGTITFQNLASFFDPIDVKTERYLLEIIFDDNVSESRKQRARELLVLHNLRFIIQEAGKQRSNSYDKTVQYHNDSLDDLILAGIDGLYVAIEKFDMKYNNRLLSYGSHWIRQYIIRESRPSSVYPQSYDELDDRDKDQIRHGELIETISNPENELAPDLFKEEVNELLSCLTSNEREIIMKYYGLNNRTRQNIDDIGASMRSSRERVRQLLNQAITKLRKHLTETKKAKIIELLDRLD